MSYTIVWDGFISLDIPDEWEYEEDHEDKLVTIYKPDNGVGAFQISFGIIHGDPGNLRTLVEKRVSDFVLRRLPEGAPVIVSEFDGSFRAHAAFLGSDAIYWEVWYWASPTRRVFMTYNCMEAERGIERDAYQAMVTSAKWA